MTEWNRLFWLFFRFSGRISRAVFALSFLLTTVVVGFPLYSFARVAVENGAQIPETANDLMVMLAHSSDYGATAETWSLMFMIAALVLTWSQVAFGVKRLHDFGRPGIIAVALMLPLVQVLALVILCVMPGKAGPNRYGRMTNAPSNA